MSILDEPQEPMVNVVYIGPKITAFDNVSGSGLIWYGAGDVKAVTVEQAKKLVKHPTVWMLEDDYKSRPNDADQVNDEDVDLQNVDIDKDNPVIMVGDKKLEELDLTELRTFASEQNITVNGRLGRARACAVVRAALLTIIDQEAQQAKIEEKNEMPQGYGGEGYAEDADQGLAE